MTGITPRRGCWRIHSSPPDPQAIRDHVPRSGWFSSRCLRVVLLSSPAGGGAPGGDGAVAAGAPWGMANLKIPRKLPVILLGTLVLVVLIALLVGIDITASNF